MQSARARFLAAAMLASAACGGGNGTPADAPPDMASTMCGAEAFFTGDTVNWDSTDAQFCGVQGAVWTVRGDTARTNTTPPNGRFQLCIPHQAQTIVDITPPLQSSGCLGADGTPYLHKAIAFASDAVIGAGGQFRARSMTRAVEMATFGYDASKAQLVVHVDGPPRAVSISSAHDAAQQFNGSSWAAAADPNAPVGSDVFFPNVAVGAVQVSVAGGATGTGTFTLEIDRFHYIAVISH